MKANLAQREPEALKRWAQNGLYQQIRQARTGADKFILHDGPPYANGEIHIGHAVNKVLKDIIVKSHSMDGLDAPYIPGWDCHGLPIELQVEKKVGKPGHKVTPAQFRKACREYARKQVNRQRDDFKRLGVLGDWDNPYLTMEFAFEADIVRSLGKIVALDPYEIKVEIYNEQHEGKIIDVEPLEWEILKYKLDPKNSSSITTKVAGTFLQYPLTLAWAITIHKSQGKTFDKVIIDLGKGAFALWQT